MLHDTTILGIFISVFNQRDAQICFTVSFISCLYMFRAHELIIRRSKLHYTTPLVKYWDKNTEMHCQQNVKTFRFVYDDYFCNKVRFLTTLEHEPER